MNLIQQLEKEEIERIGKTVPDFAPGDTVIVNVNVVEGDRKRVQAFEGVVISKRNRGLNSNFIVRKICRARDALLKRQSCRPATVPSFTFRRKVRIVRCTGWPNTTTCSTRKSNRSFTTIAIAKR